MKYVDFRVVFHGGVDGIPESISRIFAEVSRIKNILYFRDHIVLLLVHNASGHRLPESYLPANLWLYIHQSINIPGSHVMICGKSAQATRPMIINATKGTMPR